jgi:hypothetical protein
MKTIEISRHKLLEDTATALHAGVHYRFGAKAADIAQVPHAGTSIDCSGWVRVLLRRAAGITIPEGSWGQREWCESQGFKHSTYDRDGAGRMDGRVRIGFIRQRQGRSGHVWLIYMGSTLESWGGHGVGRRPWNTKVLLQCKDVFVLTDPSEIKPL